ncbi:MAG: NAD-dependent epimerase/dehydratase family protein [Deltaproteobacteria bacterium]|nr:NAD-dependent epimerase/dehydratase family protein [Deltaproteobacteria bacterium]
MSARLALITGATGYIGRHTVDALLAAGWRVRALCRNDEPELSRRGVQVVRGDVLLKDSVARALEDVEAVVHGAGLVSRSFDDATQMLRVHVVGTQHVVGLACAAGVRRIVHLSTSGTVAVGDDAEMVYREDDPVPFAHLARFPYYLSKWLAERAADDAVRMSGARAHFITLNPSLALGPGDTRGSSTLDVQRYLKREIPMVPSGGFSFVDARDVAATAVAALEAGQSGERYLLGALNCTWADFFERMQAVSGVAGPPVGITVPKRLTTLGVALLERVAGALGGSLPVSTLEAEMASCFWYCDSRKAERQLGFAARDPMATILDTVRDLRGEGRRERVI